MKGFLLNVTLVFGIKEWFQFEWHLCGHMKICLLMQCCFLLKTYNMLKHCEQWKASCWMSNKCLALRNDSNLNNTCLGTAKKWINVEQQFHVEMHIISFCKEWFQISHENMVSVLEDSVNVTFKMESFPVQNTRHGMIPCCSAHMQEMMLYWTVHSWFLQP